MYSNPNPSLFPNFFAGMFVFSLIVAVVSALVLVLPFWMIFAKAGYPGAMSLLLLIPLVGFVVLLVIAFSDWPVLRELRQWRDWHRSQQSGGQFPPPEAR
ncbi:MAG: hypothetical protein JWN15_2244 [Firmicutes bacterium]|nr:hypothetical protein [Bacillota bacterium]